MAKTVNCGYPPPPPDQMMTKKEVASLMRVEARTVNNWMAKRWLRFVRIGNTVRFRRSDVIGSMDRHEDGSTESKNDPSMV